MTDGNEDFILPAPKPEFLGLSEREILSAIKKPNKRGKLIAAEVARLVAEYMATFKTYVEKNGTEPFMLQIDVRWPIEKIAARLMIETLRSDKNSTKRITVH